MGASGLCMVTRAQSTRSVQAGTSASLPASVSIRSTGSRSTAASPTAVRASVVDGVAKSSEAEAAGCRRRAPGRRRRAGRHGARGRNTPWWAEALDAGARPARRSSGRPSRRSVIPAPGEPARASRVARTSCTRKPHRTWPASSATSAAWACSRSSVGRGAAVGVGQQRAEEGLAARRRPAAAARGRRSCVEAREQLPVVLGGLGEADPRVEDHALVGDAGGARSPRPARRARRTRPRRRRPGRRRSRAAACGRCGPASASRRRRRRRPRRRRACRGRRARRRRR